MIRIGGRGVSIFENTCRFVWDNQGIVEFKGSASIGSGSKVSVGKGAYLELGTNFSISAHSSLICKKKISFGDDCRLSWDILVMDSDFHKIKISGKTINFPKEIIIGNHVWIGCRSTIFKGVRISDEIVIAGKSLITQSIYDVRCVVSCNGSEKNVIRKDVSWET